MSPVCRSICHRVNARLHIEAARYAAKKKIYIYIKKNGDEEERGGAGRVAAHSRGDARSRLNPGDPWACTSHPVAGQRMQRSFSQFFPSPHHPSLPHPTFHICATAPVRCVVSAPFLHLPDARVPVVRAASDPRMPAGIRLRSVHLTAPLSGPRRSTALHPPTPSFFF